MSGASAFQETIDQLDLLHQQPVVPASLAGLRRIEFLLERLGNPHRSFHAVHITGSSGKGSTTAMVGSMLQVAGFRTGYFRSPHLFSYTERIAVDDLDIAPDAWVSYFDQLWPVVEDMRQGRLPACDLGRPSHGEVLFALMALHFQSSGVEWAAVEVGLGGRLDATNALSADVAVITNVSLEHTHILGDTTEAIAAEKAAIIKSGSTAVTAADDPGALMVIEERARQLRIPLIRVDHEVHVQVLATSDAGQVLRLTYGRESIDASLSVAGTFQARNAATAFAVGQALLRRGVTLSPGAIHDGLERTRIPGRFEVVQRKPTVIVDGAHNPAAALALRESLDLILPNRRVILLFAAMADKNTPEMARELGPRSRRVIVTRAPDAPRAADPALLAEQFRSYSDTVLAIESPDTALAAALNLQRGNDVLLIAGSLYLVGWARNVWTSREVGV